MKFNDTAFKHHYTVADILSCINYAYDVKILDEDPMKWNYLGFSVSGVPIEVISIMSRSGEEMVIHAMRQPAGQRR